MAPPRRLASERTTYAVLGFITLLVVWQVASALGLITELLMSSPLGIAKVAIADVTSGAIWPHLGASLREWAIGFGLTLLIGIPLGFAIGWYRRVRLFTAPWMFAIDATPTVALYPLLIIVAGIGLESKVILIVLTAVFGLIFSTMAGVQAVSWKHLEIAGSVRASGWLTLRSVVIPTTIPFILSGIRIAVGRSIVGVIIAEFLASSEGIGYYIKLNGQTLGTSRVFFALMILGLFGILAGEVVRMVERRFDAWRPSIH